METLNKLDAFLGNQTSLARGINPRYPSNLFILLWLSAVGFGALAYNALEGASFTQAISQAFFLGAGTLFAWMIGRELDPDHAGSANLAALLSPILILYFQTEPHVIALLLLVQLLRMLTRSTGQAIFIGDFGLFLVLSLWTATSNLWPLSILAAFALWLDSSLPDPPRYGRFYALILLVAAVLVTLATRGLSIAFAVDLLAWLILVTVLAVTRLIIPKVPEYLNSHTDRYPKPISGQRLRYSLTLAALTLMILGWLGGGRAILPLWSALLSLLIWEAWRGYQSKS